MPERIYKLQPNRTIALRGFDGLGASAALHSATSNSFAVSGCFRDPADFAVLMLYDADNFYEHPRLQYLPNFNFAGLNLTFDVRYTGLMPLDSPKYPTIDWHALDVIRADGSTAQVRLSDHAVDIGGTRTAAECSFTIQADRVKQYDRLTLWYENLAFDYVAPQVECAVAFAASGAGTVHSVSVAGTAYNYIEAEGDTNTAVAAGVAAAVAASPLVTAVQDSSAPNQVNLRAKLDDGVSFAVVVNGQTFELTGAAAATAAAALAAQVNATDWSAAGTLIPLQASTNGPEIRFQATIPGVDGNMLSMSALAKNERLRTTEAVAAFAGGTSDALWRVTLDFSALGIASVRQMWLTFAPPLANGCAFEYTEWEARFSNWTLTGPEETRRLRVAGPGSVRVEDSDSWCKYTGDWTLKDGFHSEGTARITTQAGARAQVKYASPAVHDLYLGTTLRNTCGSVQVSIDGGAPMTLDCALSNEAPINTRRLLRTGVSAGEHAVELTSLGGGEFWFDFIEAAVPSDVPDALPAKTDISPALDYSTDHTYKLPPSRIHWVFDKLGFAAPMNEYIGVFWWNQRKRMGSVVPQATITFDGAFEPGGSIFVRIGDGAFQFGKSVFPGDTGSTIARHFAQFINGYSVGVWAKAQANVLTVTCRSPKPAYWFALSTEVTGCSGSAIVSGSLKNGTDGTWNVDPAQSPALNRGARDWHTDMFRECAARGREITVAMSMELVNPPDGFGAVYLNGDVVKTDVGFAKLHSTHCSFSAAMREYQRSVYCGIADLMSQAGLTPSLQFGEFVWWFFNGYLTEQKVRIDAGMAYYDSETRAAAQQALGPPLHSFQAPIDDPAVNGYADAEFLRARLRDHVAGLAAGIRAVHPNARLEVLFPYDVNHPAPAGVHNLGGRLNRFVNLPVEWESKQTAGFDRFKTEALDFGAWSRNLDLARTAWELPLKLAWPRDSLRHLVPVFRPGYAWEKEVAMARAAGIPVVNLWAWDHVCLYNLAVTEQSKGRAMQIG